MNFKSMLNTILKKMLEKLYPKLNKFSLQNLVYFPWAYTYLLLECNLG